MKRYLGDKMGMLSKLKERCYAFVHADVHPEFFPIDAWTDARYADWFERHRAKGVDLANQRGSRFSWEPTFSFIVPLYKTPLPYLRDMADSVLGQTYGNLELVLINASPEDPELKAALQAYAKLDDRVKLVELEGNRGITENTNCGLAAAEGDFVCFLDHDDFIESDTLFEYASALNRDSSIDVLYCDEDMVMEDRGGFRHLSPLFKPSFSPELLLSKNYIMHLMTIRRSIVDGMPAPDARYDGSQDYNMLLYATSQARKVYGVQKVLYHWRISDASTATNPDSKPYSRRSARLAIQNQLKRGSLDADIIASGVASLYNLWFGVSGDQKISVVVRCGCERLAVARFVEWFEQTNSFDRCELIMVVPNRGVLPEEFVAQGSYVIASEDQRLFECFNRGARSATGDYLLFMDDSCSFLTPEPLEQLIGMCSLRGIGAVAPKTLYADGMTKCFGIAITSKRIMPLYRGYPDDFPGYQCNMRAFQNCSAVGYQGLVTPAKAFFEAGGFDERFEGDVGTADYCLRLRNLGYRIVQTPTVKVECEEKSPRERYDNSLNALDFSEADIAYFDEKWPGLRSKGDPYFNKNLDQGSGYFQVASF